MTLIDFWAIGFFFNLVFLPYIAVRYNLLQVRTVLETEFSTRKINEFILINLIFSLGSFLTDFLLLIHFSNRKYVLWLARKKQENLYKKAFDETLIPQISSSYDITGTTKKKNKK
jgi:hypothetical protein